MSVRIFFTPARHNTGLVGITTFVLLLCSCEKQEPQQTVELQPQAYVEPAPSPPPPPPPPPPAPPPPPTIETATVTLSVACTVPPPDPRQVFDDDAGEYRWVQDAPPPLERAPLVASGLTLTREDGSSVRFSDERNLRPGLQSDRRAGDYILTIRYQPQKLRDLIGRPVTSADGFVAIETKLRSVLSHQGLLCDRIRTLTFSVNGSAIASAVDLALPTSGEAIDLPEAFQTAGSSLMTGLEAGGEEL